MFNCQPYGLPFLKHPKPPNLKLLCFTKARKIVQGSGMYKPWPKCPTCKAPMSLKRRTNRLDDIVEAVDSSFTCDDCKQPRTPWPFRPGS